MTSAALPMQLGHPSRSVRVSSALMAVTIALLSLHVLRGARVATSALPERREGVLVFLPVTPPPTLKLLASLASPGATAPAGQHRSRPAPRLPGGPGNDSSGGNAARADGRPDDERQPPATGSTEPGYQASGVAMGASAPESKPPLDLGDRVLRAAAVGIKSPIRRMADASHQDLDSPRPAPFANAIAEAAVPGCLGRDALEHDPPPVVAGFVLGGLLALPVYAHAVVTGKCKS